MSERSLVFMDAKSSKFWKIKLSGKSHTVTYGRTGTDGQTKTKDFESTDKAKASYDKLVAAKLSKGYVDAGADAGDSGDSGQLPFVAFSSVKTQDDIYANVKTFAGKRVATYSASKGPAKGGKTTYRFRSDWEDDTLVEDLEHFIATDQAEEATGLVIGSWGGDDSQRKVDFVIELLVKHKKRLPKLISLFLGDIISEENEMSWIQQGDLGPILNAFPNLQVLRTRGGEGLKLSKPSHRKLRALACESGGLSSEFIRSVCTSKFPELEYLELWLGTDEYGGDSSVQDLQPLLNGKLFPKLKYLGLRNCQYADDIAAVIVNAPVIEQVETLDLSLGVLTDEGAQALLNLSDSSALKNVNLHYNYFTKPIIKSLKSHKITFDTSKPKHMEMDEEWRFVAVGE